jgi:hypothetical protein
VARHSSGRNRGHFGDFSNPHVRSRSKNQNLFPMFPISIMPWMLELNCPKHAADINATKPAMRAIFDRETLCILSPWRQFAVTIRAECSRTIFLRQCYGATRAQ